jgi:predicted nucleic acid-binding protein
MTTTAVDLNILIDIVSADPTHGSSSRAAIERCALEGSLISSPEVVAEFAAGCRSASEAVGILQKLKVEYVEIGQWGAAVAGEVRGRKSSGGRIFADFLIAGHAVAHADRLLTRDLGFARMNVPGLVVVSPDSLLA